MIRLIIQICLLNLVMNECLKGCLKCLESASSLSTCEICDFFSNYMMTETGHCEKTEIENCEKYNYSNSFPDKCILCSQKYYFSISQSKCLQVQNENLVENCKYYDLNQNCSQCENKFYKRAGQCISISQSVNNCEYYKNDFQCSKCKPEFWLNSISNRCEAIKSVPNCSNYSIIECSECQKGYFLNQNNQINFIDSKTLLLNQMFLRDLYSSSLNISLSPKISQCRKSLIENCITLSSFDNCLLCQQEYYRNSEGKCIKIPEDRIDNCEIYLSSTICKKCLNNFFLEGNKCTQSQIVPNCFIYHALNDSCDRCSDAYYFELNNQTCVRRLYFPIMNCEVYHKNKEECEECREGKRITDDKLGCFSLVQNCKTYHPVFASSSLKHSCSVCEEGYYPSDDANCEQHLLNSKKCFDCKKSYFINQDGQCTSQNIDNCDEYIPNQNRCKVCRNLFYASNGLCQPISSQFLENCRISEINQDGCRYCANGFYKKDGRCILIYSRDIIKNCLFTSSTEDNGCQECREDYLAVTFTKNCRKMPSGCQEFYDDGVKCKQCREFHQGDGANQCQIFPTQAICAQLKKDIFTTFEQTNISGGCEKCNDYSKYFLSNGKCQIRQNLGFNCEFYEELEDRCKVCKKDSVLSNISNKIFCNEKLISSPKLNCIAHDIFDPSICRACRPGFTLRDNACFSHNSFTVPQALQQINLTPVGNLDALNLFGKKTNCEESTYSTIYLNNVNYLICGFCKSSYIMIVKSTSARSPYYPHGRQFNKDTKEFFPNLPTAKTCISTNESFVKDSEGNSLPTSKEDCIYGEYTQHGYVCLKCVPGKTGIVVKAGQTSSGTSLSESVFTIKECVSSTSEMSKELQGLGYHNFNLSILPHGTFINFDTCSDVARELVFVGNIIENGQMYLDMGGTPGNELKNHLCALRSSLSQAVQNCQIHFSRAGTFIDYFKVTECVSCKPGYYAANIDSVTQMIRSCQPIVNCQLSNGNSNSWMNSCQTCNIGFSWEYDSGNKLIKFERCIQSPTLSCLAFDIQNEKCVICKENYTLTENNKCLNISSSDNCEVFGSPFFRLNGENITSFIKDGSFVKYFLKEDKQLFGCEKCKSGFNSFTGVGKLCIDDPIVKSDAIPNCSLHSFTGNDEIQCFECADNFVPLKDKTQCIPISDVPFNCIKAIKLTVNRFGCFECKEGFFASANYDCVTESQTCANLIRNDPEKGTYCEYCKKEFKLENGTCNPINSSEICNQFDKNGNCILCKEPGTIPLIYVTQYNQKLTKCVGFSLSKFPEGISSQNELNLLVRYNFLFQRLELEPSFCPDSFYKVPITSEDNIDQTVCVKNVSVNACLNYNEAGFCVKCENFYGPDFSGNCVKDLIKNCKIYKTADLCELCEEGHYLVSSGNICSKYSVQNCKEFHPNLNQCLSCLDGFWKNQDGDCLSYLVTNCLENSLDSDTCLKCESEYYLNSGGKCIKSTLRNNCLSYSESSDECSVCLNGYYLSLLKECVVNPSGIPNCIVYNSEGACSVCRAHFYVFLGNCQPVSNPVTFCLEYFDNGFCSKCESGYFPNNLTECKAVSESSCKEWIDSNNCKSCESNKVLMFRGGFSVCSESTLPQCRSAKFDFVTEKVICLECERGFYINNSSSCSRSSFMINNCLIYEGDSLCKVCEDNYILSADKRNCSIDDGESGEYCLKSKYLSQVKCQFCDYGFYLDIFGDCKKCSMVGCAICTIDNLNKCSLCMEGYFMNKQLQCIRLEDSVSSGTDGNQGNDKFQMLFWLNYFFFFNILI